METASPNPLEYMSTAGPGRTFWIFTSSSLSPRMCQPGAEQIVRGGFFRAQDELAAHGVRTAVDIGITGIGSLGLQDRAVGADIDGVEIGFVVADADDVELPLEAAMSVGRLRIRRFSIGSRPAGKRFCRRSRSGAYGYQGPRPCPILSVWHTRRGTPHARRSRPFAVARRLLREKGADTGRKPEGSSKHGIS